MISKSVFILQIIKILQQQKLKMFTLKYIKYNVYKYWNMSAREKQGNDVSDIFTNKNMANMSLVSRM